MLSCSYYLIMMHILKIVHVQMQHTFYLKHLKTMSLIIFVVIALRDI